MIVEESYQEVINKIIDRWRLETPGVNDGASESDLVRFERNIDVWLPAEFRYLYSVANGMSTPYSDNLLFYFWPLEEIIRMSGVTKRTDGSADIAFGDFLIDSHRYLAAIEPDGICLGVHVDFEEKMLANSMKEFFEIYLTQPDKIYL